MRGSSHRGLSETLKSGRLQLICYLLGSENVESSNSSVHTTALEKDNPQQPLWRYVKKIGKGPDGGGNVMFACNFCESKFTGSYTRCKAHLLHIGGIGIRPCPKLTNEDIKILKKEQDAAEKKSSSKSSVLVPLFASEQQENASKKRKSTLTHAFNNMGRAEMDRRIGSSGSSKYWDVNPDDIDVQLEGEHDLHAVNMDFTEPVAPSNLHDATEENQES
ncbi:hypothetical protein EJ110_NYTH55935 [Nymphaea thermarum]|nr:hypothetical protein EJ110_NYTH55935 [Nymphaea thermarum]